MARRIDLGRVVGAIGPQGEQGPQGAQGPQGPQGPHGPQGPQGQQGPSVPVDTTFSPESGNPATSAAIASWALAKNLSNLRKPEACVMANYPMPTNVTASITGSGTFAESGWVYISAIVEGPGAHVGISVGSFPYVSYADYAGSAVTLLVPVAVSNTYNVFTSKIQDGSLSIIFIKNVANAI